MESSQAKNSIKNKLVQIPLHDHISLKETQTRLDFNE